MIGVGVKNCRKVFCYDFDKKEIFILLDMFFQCYFQVVIFGRTLYLVGGYLFSSGSDLVIRVSVFCFDDVKQLRFFVNVGVYLL